MSIYSHLPKRNLDNCLKQNIIRKTFSVDYNLYEKLKYLNSKIYDVSINTLVNVAIEYLIENEEIELYPREKGESSVDRTYLIPYSTLEGLESLKVKYNVSLTKLVNVAIYVALMKENK